MKVTPLAFIIQAAVRAMREFPVLNSQLDEAGQNLLLKKFFNVGFAADTPNGLLVPVIKNADKLDVFAVAKALGDLSGKARDGKLPGTDMQGAGFTISSLGGVGGTMFTPIINSPEVAILGVSKSADEARVGRQAVPAASHAAAVVLVRPSRHRRRAGRAHRQVPRGHARQAEGSGRGDVVSKIDLVVPDLGNFDEVAVVDVLVKVGDKIEVETPLVTLETDKATDGRAVHGRRHHHRGAGE